MDKLERDALERLASQSSVEDVEQVMKNAKGKSDVVYQAAFRRLVELHAYNGQSDAVTNACWEMVHTIEQIRREEGRKVWRMNRLRPKIEKEGERAALEYCARNRTDGFDEVIGYGLPEFTAEAIVLALQDEFDDEELLRTASARLREAGIDPDTLPKRPL